MPFEKFTMIKNLSQIVAFDAVARHLSFARAARELGLAPSSIAKSVNRLESMLNVKLFTRTTRVVHLTHDGEVLHGRCADVLAQIDALSQLTEASSSSVQGVLRVSAPIGYGGKVIVPIIARLLKRHRQLRVDLRLTDERVDLAGDGLDAAIRFGKLPDSNLVARELQKQPLLLCASPRYLQDRVLPKEIDDLVSHEIVSFRMPDSGRDRPLEFRVGDEVTRFTYEPRLQVSQGSALVDALLNDSGVAQLPHFMVESLLAKGELIELLPSLRPDPMDVTLLTPHGRALVPRLKIFMDELRSRP